MDNITRPETFSISCTLACSTVLALALARKNKPFWIFENNVQPERPVQAKLVNGQMAVRTYLGERNSITVHSIELRRSSSETLQLSVWISTDVLIKQFETRNPPFPREETHLGSIGNLAHVLFTHFYTIGYVHI